MRRHLSSLLSVVIFVGFVTLCGFTILTQLGVFSPDDVMGSSQYVPRQMVVQKIQVLEYYQRANRKSTRYAYVQIEASDDSSGQPERKQIVSQQFEQTIDAIILSAYYRVGQRATFYHPLQDLNQLEFQNRPRPSAWGIALGQALYLIVALVLGSGVLAIFILVLTETRFGDYCVRILQPIAIRIPFGRNAMYMGAVIVAMYGVIGAVLFSQYRSVLHVKTYQPVTGQVIQSGVHVLGTGENAAIRTGIRPIVIFTYRVGDMLYVGAGETNLVMHPLNGPITVYVDLASPKHYALTRDKPIYFALLLIPLLIMLVILSVKILRSLEVIFERYLPDWLGGTLVIGVGIWMFLQLFVGGAQAMYWLNGNQKALLPTSLVMVMPLLVAGLCMALLVVWLALAALWQWVRTRLGR